MTIVQYPAGIISRPAVWGKDPMLVVGKASVEICLLRLFSNASGRLKSAAGTFLTGFSAQTQCLFEGEGWAFRNRKLLPWCSHRPVLLPKSLCVCHTSYRKRTDGRQCRRERAALGPQPIVLGLHNLLQFLSCKGQLATDFRRQAALQLDVVRQVLQRHGRLHRDVSHTLQ